MGKTRKPAKRTTKAKKAAPRAKKAAAPKVKKAAPKARKAAPKAKKAPPKPRKAPPKPTTPAPVAAASTRRWHVFPARPSELEVRDHVEKFMQAIQAAEIARAFTLCPLYTFRDPLLVGADAVADIENTLEGMRQALVGYDYVTDDDPVWLQHVTPPSRVAYEDLNLAVPEDGGDTLANVFVDDMVTDVTAIFSLHEDAGGWVLAFKMFKVM